MSQTIKSTGKTIDQAIENALDILGKRKDEVNIEITQRPESGVFGLFGRKDAIVEVTTIDPEIDVKSIFRDTPLNIEETRMETPSTQKAAEPVVEEVEEEVVEEPKSEIELKEESAKKFLNNLFKTMGLDVKVDTNYDGEFLRINLSGNKMGILIGRRGQTLDAIQYITSLVINKNSDDYTRLIIDTENYREKRKETLENLADKMAYKAQRYHKRVSLEPMNPAERRIIHARLQNNDAVFTYSEGQDPYRRVVIQNKNRD